MILKPGKSANEPTSYRPISLLPTLGKLMERVMIARISQYMIHQNLLNSFQAGFRRGKSCVHQLLRLTEHVSKWCSKQGGGRTVSLFIDAEKAFNTLWMDGLRMMLHDAKIPDKIVRWI